MANEAEKRWEELDKLDGLRDEPAKDNDAIRAELDELEGKAAKEWYEKRRNDLNPKTPPI